MRYLVTGGSRGIGASIVKQALADGHDVALTFRHGEAEAREIAAEARWEFPGQVCAPFSLDVRDPAAVDAVCNAAAEALGGVDVVIHSAGVTIDNLLVNMEVDQWRDVIDTNLTGAFYVYRAVLPHMLCARFGRIIGISSVSASGAAGQANYAASKAGLCALIRSIAKEYGSRGITANVVLAGWFDTQMTAAAPPGRRDQWEQHCPVGRTGDAEELSRVVTFLASPASGYINGAVIPVTGGLDHVL